jgi:hypothetical protein
MIYVRVWVHEQEKLKFMFLEGASQFSHYLSRFFDYSSYLLLVRTTFGRVNFGGMMPRLKAVVIAEPPFLRW